MSGMFRQASNYDRLAILNKHKLTDDDYKTGVLTRFTGEALAGAQHEVLWLASNASLTAWNFQDVCHVVHYDLPADATAYVLRSTIARGARVTTFVNTGPTGAAARVSKNSVLAYEQGVPGDPVGAHDAALQDDAHAVETWLLPFLRRTGVSVSVQAIPTGYAPDGTPAPEGTLSQLKSMADGLNHDVWA
jgi:hypothetical protein